MADDVADDKAGKTSVYTWLLGVATSCLPLLGSISMFPIQASPSGSTPCHPPQETHQQLIRNTISNCSGNPSTTDFGIQGGLHTFRVGFITMEWVDHATEAFIAGQVGSVVKLEALLTC